MIRVVSTCDIVGIVAVHQEAFPGFFMTKMGKAFLRAYYGIVLEYEKRIFLVSEDDKGEINGFVCGVRDPAVFYEIFARMKKKLFWPTLIALLKNPFLFRDILLSKRRVQNVSKTDDVSDSIIELTSIGVSKRVQGRGIGKELTLAFLDAARMTNARAVQLTTDRDDNETVNRFYQRIGFSLRREMTRPNGRNMNEYIYELK